MCACLLFSLQVPFALFLITHSYFHFYHVLSNMVLRLAWRRFNNRVGVVSVLAIVVLIAVMSWIVAFMETFTIQNVRDRRWPPRRWQTTGMRSRQCGP